MDHLPQSLPLPRPPHAAGLPPGFSLIELIVAMTVLLIASGTALTGLLNMTKQNNTISNRSEMHAGVRNATELLQQEVGQAGRITLPGTVTLSAPVAIGTATVVVTSVSDMFVNELLTIDTGDKQETVAVTAINTTTNAITAFFVAAHGAGTPVAVSGGFSAGVVPTTLPNGSTGSVLKIFGDINDNGSMVYVEYQCDTAGGNLYRRSMAFNAVSKPAITPDQSLLNNVVANPDASNCFTYEQKIVSGTAYVVDVAITLTVQTPDKDPVTGLYQKETKALLNVSPRNVFNVWQLAGLGITNRVQPTPATVTTLLAGS
jgi:prepilin-type N-terminal cleavage/methylation domain-containing protein